MLLCCWGSCCGGIGDGVVVASSRARKWGPIAARRRARAINIYTAYWREDLEKIVVGVRIGVCSMENCCITYTHHAHPRTVPRGQRVPLLLRLRLLEVLHEEEQPRELGLVRLVALFCPCRLRNDVSVGGRVSVRGGGGQPPSSSMHTHSQPGDPPPSAAAPPPLPETAPAAPPLAAAHPPPHSPPQMHHPPLQHRHRQ